jgi:hypothetical protein
MRRLARWFWVLVALVFLFEAWLWDHLQPLVARLVALLPWRQLKAKIAAWIDHLPPTATLIVFVVPVALLLPLKFAGVWLLARGHWFGAVGVLVLAKMVGLGVTAFLFDATRDKLLQIAWFRWLYDHVMAWRDLAHALIDPIKRRIRAQLRLLSRRGLRRAVRLLLRVRRRAARPGDVRAGWR